MSRRVQRVGNLLRQIIGQAVLSKLSDPRIDPARTSVTRVEIPEDLLTAKVYVSVLGTAAEQRRTLRALQHAAGHIQELMRQQITLRHTPVLTFELDVHYKKALQTLEIIEQAMDEIHQREQARAEEAPADEAAPAAAPSPQPGSAENPAPDEPARRAPAD
jgi:ribosome-binding factor A